MTSLTSRITSLTFHRVLKAVSNVKLCFIAHGQEHDVLQRKSLKMHEMNILTIHLIYRISSSYFAMLSINFFSKRYDQGKMPIWLRNVLIWCQSATEKRGGDKFFFDLITFEKGGRVKNFADVGLDTLPKYMYTKF